MCSKDPKKEGQRNFAGAKETQKENDRKTQSVAIRQSQRFAIVI